MSDEIKAQEAEVVEEKQQPEVDYKKLAEELVNQLKEEKKSKADLIKQNIELAEKRKVEPEISKKYKFSGRI